MPRQKKSYKRMDYTGTVWAVKGKDGKAERFRGRIRTGKFDPDTGKPDEVNVSGATRKEVEEKLLEVAHGLRVGTYQHKKDILVSDLADKWISYKKIRDTTAATYEHLIRNHIKVMFEGIQVQELTMTGIKETYKLYYDNASPLNGDNSTEYSRSSMMQVANLMKQILDYAVESDIIKRNPHQGLLLSKLKVNVRDPRKPEAYTVKQQELLTQESYKKKHDWIYIFMFATGMRTSEINGLQWDQVEYENAEIFVNRQSVDNKGRAIIVNYTKTEDGLRKVPLPPAAIALLKKIQAGQNEELNRLNLVFPTRNYTLRNSGNSRKQLKLICERIGVPYLSGQHVFRHSYATRAIENGMDVATLANILGHKNVETTLNTYVSALTEHKRNSIAFLDDLIAKK